MNSIEELLAEMPDTAPMKLAIVNVKTAMIVSRVLLKDVQNMRATNDEVLKLTNMLLEQESYFTELFEDNANADD